MRTLAPQILPRRWLGGHAAVAVVFLAVLTWLNLQAESVDPVQHDRYTQHLRYLRELDAEIDSELLANRLELSRSYDNLAHYCTETQRVAAELLDTPPYLAGNVNDLVTAAQQLIDTLREKELKIDDFKRDNAVLRNSLAFFPTAASELLDNPNCCIKHNEYQAISRYTRLLLSFARSPDNETLVQIREASKPIVSITMPKQQRQMTDNLLRHGDVITERLGRLNQLTQDILDMKSSSQLETLNRLYNVSHDYAIQRATYYRIALYTFAILLVIYLVATFLKLDQVRRSLEVANEEVNKRYAAQLVVEKQLRLHSTVFQNAHNGIVLTDTTGNILDVNPAFSRITGWERDEVIGRNPRLLKSGRHDQNFYAAMWLSIQTTGIWRGEIWNRNKYGVIYPELLSISTVHDHNNVLTNYVAVFADITRIKDQENQLTHMAYYDGLTGLPNRALLADRLTHSMSQTRSSGLLMAIVYLDLDGFKPINDIWGHETGDRVLIEISHRLNNALRGGDTLARVGGDEFVILLLDFKDREEVLQTVQRLLDIIAEPLPVTPQPSFLTGSIGITLYPEDDSPPDTLLRHADQAMYQAKQTGKNRCRLFDPKEDRDTRTRHDQISQILEALQKDEFVLHYQPKVNMRSGKVIGVEALIRWHQPLRGIVYPNDFLPLIENHDSIIAVGDWVIETALTQMERWRTEGLELSVSVNVAGQQIQDPDFVLKLQNMLEQHTTVSNLLELEILETSALEDVVKISQVIETCRTLGISFALDDFGTGYSSLTYLKRLPTETIKIDQSFVREILSDQNNLVIVQGVLSLSNAFQRIAIAEGVETADHGRILLQLGCDLAQGYGIAKPMAAEHIVNWVKQWQPDPVWSSVRDLYWPDADQMLMVYEVELRNWVAQLIYTTKGHRPVPHKDIENHHKCRFGRWHYDYGQDRYGKFPAFQRIDQPHQRIHRIASCIEKLCRDGNGEEACKMLPDLISARDEVLAAMRDLQLAVAQPR